VLSIPGWSRHRPGQHVDVRLTAEDGYQAQRSYSIASAPEAEHVMLTVDRIEEGEVSPYLTRDVQVGDRFELRGPDRRLFRVDRGDRRAAVPGGRRLGGRAR
jgi:ferredoxin-NADP reductase